MADEKVIFTMTGVTKFFEKKPVFRDISLSYFFGAKIGVLGLNGSGKSTLLKIMAGEDQEFDGSISQVPGYTLGYLAQEPRLDEHLTVQECVMQAAAGMKALLEEYEDTFIKVSEADDPKQQERILARQGEIQSILDARGGWDLDARIEMAMEALRCPPADAKVAGLSGGEKRRVALCRLLLMEPDILLLDEPTNHLDADTVGWLERHLQGYKGTVIAITHDRYFLDNVAGWILELDRGRGIPWKGNYSSWLEQKRKRLEAEDKQSAARTRSMEREREWAAASPKARVAKNKARLRAYEQMLTQDQGPQEKAAEIWIPPGPRLGGAVIEARGLTKGFGDRVLMEDVDFSLPAGGIERPGSERLRLMTRKYASTHALTHSLPHSLTLTHSLLYPLPAPQAIKEIRSYLGDPEHAELARIVPGNCACLVVLGLPVPHHPQLQPRHSHPG
jgi:ATPase subunit of ABC transporter with duplicated ATPase domains